jgi:hypothetical protein
MVNDGLSNMEGKLWEIKKLLFFFMNHMNVLH